MCSEEHAAAVAAFIRSPATTRCPTAAAVPPQPPPPAADRAALQRYAALRSQSRRQQVAGRDRSFWAAKVLAGYGEKCTRAVAAGSPRHERRPAAAEH